MLGVGAVEFPTPPEETLYHNNEFPLEADAVNGLET